MLSLRKAKDRFHTDIDWLDSWHTFSFGEHYDPKHMGFGPLRVINDDRVAGGGGFPTHAHRDMEIITIVLEGALAHKDSMGNGTAIRPGEVQKMSAGKGITHSEFNASPSDPVHLLQIWIIPEAQGITPSYQQITVEPASIASQWRLMAAPEEKEDVILLHQDAYMYLADLKPGQTLDYEAELGRNIWLHVAQGSIKAGDIVMSAGDGLALRDEANLIITGKDDSKLLLFDMGD